MSRLKRAMGKQAPHGMSAEDKLNYFGWEVSSAGCWLWKGNINSKGYASMHVKGLGKVECHRIAYLVWVGEIESGLQVRHTCDNPPCINPEHLVLGTIADNMRDKVERNRQLRGETHNLAKLTEVAVRDIRRRRAAGERLKPLAEQYGVSETMVSYVVRGKNWSHVVDTEATEDVG